MSDEFDSILQNSNWDLVQSKPTQNIVSCKWIFRLKRDLDDTFARYKVRLVAKGLH